MEKKLFGIKAFATWYILMGCWNIFLFIINAIRPGGGLFNLLMITIEPIRPTLTVLYLVSAIGVLKYKEWARILFITCSILVLVVILFIYATYFLPGGYQFFSARYIYICVVTGIFVFPHLGAIYYFTRPNVMSQFYLKTNQKEETMLVMGRSRFLIAAMIALFVYFVGKGRLGMTIIAFLLTDIILKESFVFNRKKVLEIVIAIILFFIGRYVSFQMAGFYIASKDPYYAFSFAGGFFDGIIEMETYVFAAVFFMKLYLCKNLQQSLQYLTKVFLICFVIAGLVQGSYMQGWQNVLFI